MTLSKKWTYLTYTLLSCSILGGQASVSVAEPERLENLEEVKGALYNEPHLPSTGPASGKTVIVEFFDYSCPHCRAMYPPIHEVTGCDPNVRVVYRHLPLLGPDSKMLAKGALAAHLQGKFETMHTWLMTKGWESDRTQLLQYAQKIPLDMSKFIRDLDGDELEKVFDHTIGLALKLNVRNVPAIIVGDHISREGMSQKEFMDLLNKVHEENGSPVSKVCAPPSE